MDNKIKGFIKLLDQLQATYSDEELVNNLSSLLIRMAQKNYRQSVGFFSQPVTVYFRTNNIEYLDGYTIPARVEAYRTLLRDNGETCRQRLINFYSALLHDDKVQHANLRDKIWDEVDGALGKKPNSEPNLTEKVLDKAFCLSIDISHAAPKAIKDELVGDRDVIDAFLLKLFKALNSKSPEKFEKKYDAAKLGYRLEIQYTTYPSKYNRAHQISEIAQSL